MNEVIKWSFKFQPVHNPSVSCNSHLDIISSLLDIQCTPIGLQWTSIEALIHSAAPTGWWENCVHPTITTIKRHSILIHLSKTTQQTPLSNLQSWRAAGNGNTFSQRWLHNIYVLIILPMSPNVMLSGAAVCEFLVEVPVVVNLYLNLKCM